MKPNPNNNPVSTTPRRARKRRWPIFVLLLLVAAIVAGVIVLPSAGSGDANSDNVVDEVKFGQLTVSVDGDEGEIKPGDYRLLTNELEGSSTIISLVDPGTLVKKGDLILELDASTLKDRKVDQEIVVQLAEAAFIRSRETLAVIKKQNESNIKVATLNRDFAKQDITTYVEGNYKQQLRVAQSAIKLAEARAEDAKQVYEWSQKLFKQKFITQTDLNRDKLNQDQKVIDLETAEGALDLLVKFTHKRQMLTLQADVEAAEFTKVLVEHRAASDIVDGQANLKAKEIKLKREKEKLAKLEEQIVKSRIIAPIDGMVLYIQDKYRNPEGLSVGAAVYERQRLVRLPTTSKLLAEVKVHESQLRKIKVGMPVEVSTDAVANKTYWGKLSKISVMPDATHRYGNPFLKVYTTVVEFDGATDGLRAGMSCKGKIIVDQFDDVAYVPIQAVVHEEDETVVYVPGPSEPVRRPVKLGMDNNVHVIITEGLAKGDKVLLAPTLSKSYVPPKKGPVQVPDDIKTAASPLENPADKKSAGSEDKPSNELETSTKSPSIKSDGTKTDNPKISGKKTSDAKLYKKPTNGDS